MALAFDPQRPVTITVKHKVEEAKEMSDPSFELDLTEISLLPCTKRQPFEICAVETMIPQKSRRKDLNPLFSYCFMWFSPSYVCHNLAVNKNAGVAKKGAKLQMIILTAPIVISSRVYVRLNAKECYVCPAVVID